MVFFPRGVAHCGFRIGGERWVESHTLLFRCSSLYRIIRFLVGQCQPNLISEKLTQWIIVVGWPQKLLVLSCVNRCCGYLKNCLPSHLSCNAIMRFFVSGWNCFGFVFGYVTFLFTGQNVDKMWNSFTAKFRKSKDQMPTDRSQRDVLTNFLLMLLQFYLHDSLKTIAPGPLLRSLFYYHPQRCMENIAEQNLPLQRCWSPMNWTRANTKRLSNEWCFAVGEAQKSSGRPVGLDDVWKCFAFDMLVKC